MSLDWNLAEESTNRYPLSVHDELKKRGGDWMIHTPTAYQLFIDIDSEEQLKYFRRAYNDFKADLGLLSYDLKKSRTAGHYHIRVTLNAQTGIRDRILLQAVLGSDPKRELLSLIRLERGISPEIAFLEEIK